MRGSDSQSDFLFLIVFVLGTMCIMRSLHLAVPQACFYEFYENAFDNDLPPPLQ
jgi:hypothetical protein